MSEYSRRDWLRGIALAVAGAETIDAQDAQHVHQMAAADKATAAGRYRPKAFNAHEYATLERLTDLIIPPEVGKSGALAAGAAAWIDMLASQNDRLKDIYSGGLAWLDHTAENRAGKKFVDSLAAQQTELLDQIAYRRNKSAELGPGIRFFDWARRMTVDAFYTSQVGIDDIDYRGNSPVSTFEVPEEAIQYALKRSGYA